MKWYMRDAKCASVHEKEGTTCEPRKKNGKNTVASDRRVVKGEMESA